MTAKFDQVRSIFMAAIERPADQWEAYLDKACGAETGLREQVDMLLQAHRSSRGLLDHPTGANMATALPPAPYRAIAEGPGTMVGRYKLLQQIGEGGMGVVYMAEQEKPVRRRVAL